MGSNPAIPTIDLGGGPRQRPAVPVLREVAVLDDLLHALGYGLCHQLPERSFFGGGVQAPVCARDTGIYVGFVISLLLLWALHRGERPRDFPHLRAWVFFGASVAFMGWDGVTSYAGLRTTTNLLRLASGMGVGFSAAALITPMLNDTLWRVSGRGRLLDPPGRFIVWVLAAPVSTAALWLLGPRLGVVYPLLIAGCIVVTLASINLVMVGMLPKFDRKAERGRDLVPATAVSLAIALLEVWGAFMLREFLVSLVA